MPPQLPASPGVTRSRLSTILRSQQYAPASERVPGLYDDAAAGFAVGHLWLPPRPFRVSEAKRVTASNAVWAPRATAPLLAGNALASGLAAAYGMRKLLSGYTGFCLRVQRTSDSTTLDVGFLPDGRLDSAAIATFLFGTTGFVVTWYDQSGNLRDATATTTARPTVTPFPHIGNAPAIFFDNYVSTNGGTKIKQALTIPAGLSLTSNSVSVVSLAAFQHATRNAPLIELSGTTPLCFGNATQTGTTGLVLHYSSFSTTQRMLLGFRPPMNPIISGFGCGAANVLIWGADRATKTGTAIAGTALAGGLIGGTTKFLDGASDPDFGYNAQAALLIYNRQITATEYTTAAEALYYDFEVAPQRRGNLVCDGDSITEGAYSTYFQGWPRRMIPLLSTQPHVYDAGIMGGTFGAASSGTAAVVKWVGLYDATAPFNLVILSLGTNDLQSGITAAATYTALQTYLAAVQPTGWRVILRTILRRSNITGSLETERLAYNALLRANYAALGCVALIDDEADATMGAAGVTSDVTIFQDGTHPTNLGYAYLAQIAANTINAYLAPA